jgi:hypothetical protein
LKFNLSFLWVCVSVLGLVGCSGGSSSSTASCVTGSGSNVTVSGRITFDRVPLDSTGALDFPATSVEPARKITVEAVCNSVLTSTTTDDNGNYSLSVPLGTNGLLVRARAQMLQSGNPGWDVKVLDEQQAVDLVFALDSSPLDVNSALTRNLHAPSGSDGTNYTSARIAAPFAIPDTVYKSMQLVMQANPTADFPPLKIKWSSSSSDGSFYSEQAKTITLLGYLIDTDEFDEHVVAHEWGHYFQDAFSRDDSIGGPHSGGDILDIRVAFSEGFGNAFSAMVLDDPLYRDSQGLTAGFTINVENNNCNIYSSDDVDGWYNECSVQSVLYDFYDITNEDFDVFDPGFDKIYQVLVDADKLRDSDAFTSLFSFITSFKALPAIDGNAVDTLLNAQSITTSITDDIGTNSSDAGGGADIPLPPYLPGADVFSGTEVCSTGIHGGYNGLGVSRYVSFTSPSTASYTFEAVRQSGLNPADPDMYLYHKGQLLAVAESWSADMDSMSANLQAGNEYVLELREYSYTDPDYNPAAIGATNTTCFTVTQTP